MERIALIVDDVAQARQRLLLLLAREPAAAHWVVVACPPARTRHIGRWASRSARAQWSRRWAQDLKDQLDPLFADTGHRVEHVLDSDAPDDLSARLEARLPGIRIVDTRSPGLAALTDASPLSAMRGWAAPLVLASGLGMVLGVVD